MQLQKRFLVGILVLSPIWLVGEYLNDGSTLGGTNAANPNISLSSPVQRQIYQRNGSSQCSVSFTGSYTGAGGPITSVKASATVIENGSSVGDTVISSLPVANAFTGTLTITPGWYNYTIKVYNGVTLLSTATNIIKGGCGEIFIAVGQSLSGNWGQVAQSAVNEFSEMLSLTNMWSPSADPQPSSPPGTFPNQGSPWPSFDDSLGNYLSMPVAILDVAVGGTSVSQWQPGGTYYNTKLNPAVTMFAANGFRAVIWGQGETDASFGTSQSTYTTLLETTIAQTRTDAGWTIPWAINIETSPDGVNVDSAIQAAQTAVATGYSTCYLGANVDTLLTTTYRWAGGEPHMNPTGLAAQGVLQKSAQVTHWGW